MTAALLLVLTPGLPLLMAMAAIVPSWRPPVLRLGWVAPLPALAAVAVVPDGGGIVLRDVLFGTGLVMTETGRVVLGFTAVLWLLSALNATAYLSPSSPRYRFAVLFLLVMAGNFGLLIAADLASFYALFALMSLASYVLVVHDQTAKAIHAGAVYIVLAVIGETALLIGMLQATVAAGGIDIAAMRLALDPPGEHAAVFVCFAVGFGIKMGLFPLHVWLPLAHPAAPAPASAVLSGAMIKAGLFGMITFLPIGLDPWVAGGAALMAIGVFTAFYGVACGVGQSEAKAVLAYSSLSQMGVMASALGVGLLAPQAWPALLAALTAYMLHHGLTKGGLFLMVGARQKGAVSSGNRAVFVVATVLAAFALAGAPISSGAVAKLALKAAVEQAAANWAMTLVTVLSFSAVATTVLMVRFLYVFAPWRAGDGDGKAGPGARAIMIGTAILSILAGQAAIWWVAPTGAAGQTLSGYGAWQSGWPVALGLGVALAAATGARRLTGVPSIPQGDLLPALTRPAVDSWSFSVALFDRVRRGIDNAADRTKAFFAALWRQGVRRESAWEEAVNSAVGQRVLTAVLVVAVAVGLLVVLLV